MLIWPCTANRSSLHTKSGSEASIQQRRSSSGTGWGTGCTLWTRIVSRIASETSSRSLPRHRRCQPAASCAQRRRVPARVATADAEVNGHRIKSRWADRFELPFMRVAPPTSPPTLCRSNVPTYGYRSTVGPGMTATEPATADSPPRAVAAVLVTHNRHDVLQETLDVVLAQTRPPDSVLVVDNGSSDGTAARLACDERVRCLPLKDNLGPSGGFATALEALHGEAFDWHWFSTTTASRPGTHSNDSGGGRRPPDSRGDRRTRRGRALGLYPPCVRPDWRSPSPARPRPLCR